MLLAITYTLVSNANGSNRIDRRFAVVAKGPPVVLNGAQLTASPTAQAVRPGPNLPAIVQRLLHSNAGRQAVRFVVSDQRIADLHQLVIESLIALAIMAVICMALGWVIAGRVLRPLRTITATTQEISAANLNRRLALPGPRDELRRLADTIDGLLARLEGAFDAQRRFVANASHELRTPLTASRAMLEMVVEDPHATAEDFRSTCVNVLEEGERQEQLIAALMTLAHGQRGIERPEPIDLAALVHEVVDADEVLAQTAGVAVEEAIEPAEIDGDRRLIERLTSNLLENAIRHNLAGGRVTVAVSANGDGGVLAVSNTGPIVPSEEIERLLQPFQRMAVDRVGQGDRLGLGLSIVAAVAVAHRAELDVRPRVGGGLEVTVRFPAAASATASPAG